MAEKKAKQSSLLKKLDLYGNLFNFTVNREEKFKTNIGVFLSIITYLLIITTSIFFGTDFYERTNPKVLSQKTVPEKYSKFKITNKILTISWRIEDRWGLEIDWAGKFYFNLIYSPSILNQITKNLEISEVHILPVKRCSEMINEENFYKFKNPESWYCVDFDLRDMMFGGDWDGEFVYSFNLNIHMCKYEENGERSKECVKFEELKEFLDNRVFFSINFPRVYFDFTDYNDPVKIEYKNYYSHITRNLLRADFCYFNIPQLKDDRGWIFSDYQEKSKLSFDYCDRNYFIKQDEDYLIETVDDLIYGIDIYLSKSYPFYIRTYMKFQDLAAIVGGFVKIITLIFAFINFYFNNYERDKFIINYFFNILNGGVEEDKNNNLRNDYNLNNNSPLSKNVNFNDPLNQQCTKLKEDLSLKPNTTDKSKFKPAFKLTRKFKSSLKGALEEQKLNNSTLKEFKNTQTLYAEMGNMSRNKLNTNADNSENFEIKKFQNETSHANLKDSVPAGDFNRELIKINIKSKNSAAQNSLKLNGTDGNCERDKMNFLNNNTNIVNNNTEQISGFIFNNSVENFGDKFIIGNRASATDKNTIGFKNGCSKDETIARIADGKEGEINATVINKKWEQEESIGDRGIMNIRRIDNSEGKSDLVKSKPREVFFLNESSNKETYLGFFNYQMHKYFSFKKKKKKEHDLFQTIHFIREHIYDKFDLLKYYKRYIHYKYLKKVILSNEQRIALKNICNLKIDYKMIYRAKNTHFDNNNRDVMNIQNHLENDTIDQRIKELINNKFC